ncbi:MAG: FkbM family methyltransferase [Desulfobulbaceae bacterium]|nr:FkbM family methyltransferase [Desulfobulbaceae bacterium]
MILLNHIEEFLVKRQSRLQKKAMLKQWWTDGGDYELRFNYELDENSVVLDLGGYEGQWASDLFSRYGCRIFIFEPVRAFAERISKRFKNNNKIEVFQCGLGGSSRTESIGVSANSSSIFRKSENYETINIVEVTDWLNNKNINNIDLIKINIEGGEYELLETLIEKKMINKIKNIQIQFHNISIDSRCRMETIQNKLSDTHMATYQYTFVWENWTRI